MSSSAGHRAASRPELKVGAHQPYAKPRPRGLLRLMLKVPPLLYRIGLARRLGPRLLLLTTRGRMSGRRRTVGLNYAMVDGAVYVISGFGQTDWLRNLAANPHVEVTIGTDSWRGVARPVRDADEAGLARRLFREQARSQGPPRALRGLIRLMGLDYEAELGALDRPELDLPMVSIQRVDDT